MLLLQDALLRKHVPVKITALVNDTVGTLLSNAYQKPDTIAGLILGTGSNGAYVEKIARIGKWKLQDTTSDEMVINMEFGAFDNEKVILPITRFDNKLDRKSINPHYQTFEKLISGMYLGEVVRNVITDMMDRNLLFGHQKSTERISSHYRFETSYMSSIEEDASSDLAVVRDILDTDLNLVNVDLVELKMVKRICQLVGTRAARLAAVAIVGILTHADHLRSAVDVGIDGSLFEFYPSFGARIYEAMAELLPDYADSIRDTVRLGLARDGSGVGAALTACVADKILRSN